MTGRRGGEETEPRTDEVTRWRVTGRDGEREEESGSAGGGRGGGERKDERHLVK